MEIKFTAPCQNCNGTGIRRYNASPNGPIIEENPCSKCGGDGIRTLTTGIDSTWFDEMNEKMDYIHGKVTAIWNKVKDS